MTDPNPRSAGWLGNPVRWLALGFGAGLSPVAPGTAGSLVGIVVYLPLSALPTPWYVVTVTAAFAIGVPICAQAARNLGDHDHPSIVWDEIVGFLVAMTALPRDWTWVLGAFVLFRVFDIIKPWPIRRIDAHIKGGLGIMLDDLAAGLAALTILHLALHLSKQL